MDLNKYYKKGYILSPYYDEDDFEFFDKVELFELNEEEIKELFLFRSYQSYQRYYDDDNLILVKCESRIKLNINDFLITLESYVNNDNSSNLRDILKLFDLKDNEGYIFYPHIDADYYKNDNLMNTDYLFSNDEHLISFIVHKISNLTPVECVSNIEKYINFIKEILKERKEDVKEKKYSKETLSMIIDSLYIAGNYEKEISKDAREFYKENILKLVEDNDLISIKNLGYDYYEGVNGFPLDYDKSLYYFLKYYEMSKDTEVASPIGYIYYYDRTSSNESTKDKAFQYFALGHFTKGFFECTYKLADCYLHGYGTPISYEACFNLVNDIYEPTKNYFLNGKDTKFADVALRMGKFYKDSINVTRDLNKSFEYFLEARCAIKERINHINYVGDRSVAFKISESINYLKNELNISPRIYKHNGYVVKDIDLILSHEIFKVDFIDGFIHIYISKNDEHHEKYFLNTIPSLSFVERSEILEFIIKTNNYDNVTEFMKLINNSEILTLAIESNLLMFILLNKKKTMKVDLEIEELIMIPQNMENISKKYQVVKVEFYPGSNLYEYLSLKEVNLGDKVKVESKGEIKEVVVKEIKYLYEDELTLPLNKMSKIL